jgi:hypothetical protein
MRWEANPIKNSLTFIFKNLYKNKTTTGKKIAPLFQVALYDSSQPRQSYFIDNIISGFYPCLQWLCCIFFVHMGGFVIIDNIRSMNPLVLAPRLPGNPAETLGFDRPKWFDKSWKKV